MLFQILSEHTDDEGSDADADIGTHSYGRGGVTSQVATATGATHSMPPNERLVDLLPVPGAATAACLGQSSQSPSSLSVPGAPWSSLSRRASSTTSSIFDLSYEAEQLERAVRENNVRAVKKMLEVHCGRFHSSSSGSNVRGGGGSGGAGGGGSSSHERLSGSSNLGHHHRPCCHELTSCQKTYGVNDVTAAATTTLTTHHHLHRVSYDATCHITQRSTCQHDRGHRPSHESLPGRKVSYDHVTCQMTHADMSWLTQSNTSSQVTIARKNSAQPDLLQTPILNVTSLGKPPANRTYAKTPSPVNFSGAASDVMTSMLRQKNDLRKASTCSSSSYMYDHCASNDRRASCATDTEALPSLMFRNSLHTAVHHNALAVLKLLLQHGLNPNQGGFVPPPAAEDTAAWRPGQQQQQQQQSTTAVTTATVNPALNRDRRDTRFQQLLLTHKPNDAAAAAAHVSRRTSSETTTSNAAAVTAAAAAKAPDVQWSCEPITDKDDSCNPGDSASKASAFTLQRSSYVPASINNTRKTSASDTVNKQHQSHCLDDVTAAEAFDFARVYSADSVYLETLPPLFLAAALQRTDCLASLLHSGAHANAQDSYGNTPLHINASQPQHSVDCAATLIEHGARIHQVNRFGVSPCHLRPQLVIEQEQVVKNLTNFVHSQVELLKSNSDKPSKNSIPWIARFGSGKSRDFATSQLAARKAQLQKSTTGAFRSDPQNTISENDDCHSLSAASAKSKFSFNFRLSASPAAAASLLHCDEQRSVVDVVMDHVSRPDIGDKVSSVHNHIYAISQVSKVSKSLRILMNL